MAARSSEAAATILALALAPPRVWAPWRCTQVATLGEGALFVFTDTASGRGYIRMDVLAPVIRPLHRERRPAHPRAAATDPTRACPLP